MYLFGFTVNVVTLLSLSLVVGILVDDAIVEIENIIRHLRMGKTPYQAAMEAADEIGLAVIATTFTLIAVFLPTAFMTGIVGKFFVQFGWTAAISVFFSLVVARMLTPMMAAYLLKPNTRGHQEARWERLYMRMAPWCLRHRVATTVMAAVFFFGTLLGLTPLLPTGFIPPDDLSQDAGGVDLAAGQHLRADPSAGETGRSPGRQAFPGADDLHHHRRWCFRQRSLRAAGRGRSAQGDADDQPDAAPGTPRHQQAIRRGRVPPRPGKRWPACVSRSALGGSSEKYQLALSGDDGRMLAEHAQKVERELRGIPGVGNVTSSSSLVRPELEIRPDFARAADLGVTSEAIADTLRVALSGDYDQALAKLNLSQRQVPIVVKLRDAARQDLDLVSRLTIPGRHGPVQLANIADIQLVGGPAQIDRYDRSRNINIEVELNGVPLGTVEEKAMALPSLQQLPPGVVKAAIGDTEAMGELFEGFSLAMLTGVLCIYIVLVLLFKDFVQPVTILAALVLSVPGAILALFITRTALSMPAMIGLIMLMGVATKNSILLVEYAIMARRERGMSRAEALLDACRKRARPIVMTTVAMGAGMLPIAIGLGTDPSFRAPMAIVIIGGLITSTFLSLLVIPVLFTYVDDARAWVLKVLRVGKEQR